ncbi:MAG: superoxide dismutase family protein [Clostridia bacterium]|nr:superoxide dismutase family protein [Clostridia bacterium]
MQKYTHWLTPVLAEKPHAIAHVRGSHEHPALHGIVRFYQTRRGIVITADFTGLPASDDPCRSPVFGFHIHDGAACRGNASDPFADAGSHYNPGHCPHPQHAGDLPPVFGVGERGFLAFLTNRFTIQDIQGRTVILHGSTDDFTTQPAGNAGIKIACGEIRPL